MIKKISIFYLIFFLSFILTQVSYATDSTSEGRMGPQTNVQRLCCVTVNSPNSNDICNTYNQCSGASNSNQQWWSCPEGMKPIGAVGGTGIGFLWCVKQVTVCQWIKYTPGTPMVMTNVVTTYVYCGRNTCNATTTVLPSVPCQ